MLNIPAAVKSVGEAIKIRFDSDTLKRVVDTVHFNNGKKLIITKAYDCNTLVSKLQYLKNEAGDWVRSKLRYYKGRQVIKEMRSYNNVNQMD